MLRTSAFSIALMLAACAPANETASGDQPQLGARSATAYAAAIDDPSRPEADRNSDAARLPGQVLAFAQIDRGEKVGDYIMGGGYWTRLLSNAVGADGRVYAFQPDEFIAFRAAYADEQTAAAAGRANVTALRGPIAAPPFPEPLDTILTVQNFHDLYLEPMPEGTAPKVVAALYDALKPGGLLVVIDHSAVAGSGTSAANSIHRIDKQAAVAVLTAAGFESAGESDIYARPDDPRTANVFDASIRGQTDQFMLRFRKPE